MNIANNPFGTVQNEKIRKLLTDFFSDKDNGEPENISKVGCLKLASYGATVWNTWRTLFPPKPYGHFDYINFADFSYTDFTGNKYLDFSGFIFGNAANFSFCKWERYASFFQCEWGDDCCFIGADWGVRSTFNLVKVGDNCDFSGCYWGHDCSFEKANIGRNADFSNTYWEARTFFNETFFGSALNFNLSIWDGSVSFAGTGATGLSNATMLFHKDEQTPLISEAKSSNTFSSVSFRGAKFLGEVYFDDRIFTGETDFSSFLETEKPKSLKRNSDRSACISDGKLVFITPKNCDLCTVFYKAPSFYSAKLHVKTLFQGVRFPEVKGRKDNITAYRNLKILFGEIQSKSDCKLFERLEIAEEQAYNKKTVTHPILEKKTNDNPILNRHKIERTFAIIISIENYAQRGEKTISPVKYANNDALEFKELLINNMNVKEEDIYSFTDSQAMGADLKNGLKSIFFKLTENDRLVFYYAGHGFHNGITNYLTTYDTYPSNLLDTTVSLREVLLDPLKGTYCKNALIFIDSCAEHLQKNSHRNTVFNMDDEEFMLIASEFPSYSIFLSCQTGESSFSCDKLKHGVWTYHLIQALSGEAKKASNCTFITDKSLRDYLSIHVSKYVNEQLNHSQNPKAILESGYENIII